jgi:hypothetical protein
MKQEVVVRAGGDNLVPPNVISSPVHGLARVVSSGSVRFVVVVLA